MVRAMSTENWLDFIAISIDPRKADGMRFTINLVTPDNGEKYLIEMSNATLTNIKGEQAKSPDLTITVNRADLNQVMMGVELLRRSDQGRQGDISRATGSLSISSEASSSLSRPISRSCRERRPGIQARRT